MLSMCDLRTSLVAVGKESDALYEENKNLQAQFVNVLTELQHYQARIQQLETKNGVSTERELMEQARRAMQERQQKAAIMYQTLTLKRQTLCTKLNEGVQQLALVQNNLIGKELLEWKQMQKMEQIGAPFEDKEQRLDHIQKDFELLAEQCWQLRTCASSLMVLVQRGPQLSDNVAQQCAKTLKQFVDHLTKLLWVLISQSFIVCVQPEPVLKTQHKFSAAVRLLIGDKLGIKQQLDNTTVTVRILAEDQAKQLHANKCITNELKNDVGNVSNDFEKLQLNDHGHLCATFANSKLTRIAPRKPASKASSSAKSETSPTMMATDQKYALLFNISPFQLGNLGKFDLWTLSLPIMVIVHGSQDCDAQATILWQRAFGSVVGSGRDSGQVVLKYPSLRNFTIPIIFAAWQTQKNWAPSASADAGVSWPELGQVIAHKFLRFTGVQRPLCDRDLAYLAEKLYGVKHADLTAAPKITFHKFAKQHLRDDVSFSFWEWLFSVMQLIRQKLQVFWDEGWLVGFVSKQDASDMLVCNDRPSFLLRFSDTQTGAVSIAFVCPENNTYAPFHLAPFVAKELDQLALSQRIATCPSLKHISHLYPDIDMDKVMKRFEQDEKMLQGPNGYIGSEVIMVAKGPQLSGAATPSLPHSSNLGSPSNVFGDDSLAPSADSPLNAATLGVMGMEVGGLAAGHGVSLNDSLEQLLGADFPLPSGSGLPQLNDISLILGNLEADANTLLMARPVDDGTVEGMDFDQKM